MYSTDTNVISEARKKDKANPGVKTFFREVADQGEALYLSVVSIGELRRGVELIRYRGEVGQASMLEAWLTNVLDQCRNSIPAFDIDAAQVWGRLCVPHSGHDIDKQIAAIAVVNGLTVVTMDTADFADTGVSLLNPFLVA